MTPDPEQVEAHAAQGYSLPDVARLLGVPFFNQNSPESNAAVDAFNRGAARWRENGQPVPPRATDIIAQAVHSQLLSKEMTRPQLKDALGFRHDDLNLAVETLEAQFLIEHREDGMGTVFYRGAGTPAAKPKKVAISAPVREIVSRPQAGNNDVNEPLQPEPKPKPNGHSDIVGNKPKKISARSEALDSRKAGHETAVSPENEKIITRAITAKPERLVPIERELPEPNGHNYQVKYEGLTIFCGTQDEVVAIVNRLQGPIPVPTDPPVAPRIIKRAWSKDFEDDDAHGEGVPGLTMLYLISLFHDGMEEHEKEAVFTLIRYLKRIQAANEAATEAKKEV